MKEVESSEQQLPPPPAPAAPSVPAASDPSEGLNLSVSRHAELGSTKLEALLNKPIEEPCNMEPRMNNGDASSRSSEGV